MSLHPVARQPSVSRSAEVIARIAPRSEAGLRFMDDLRRSVLESLVRSGYAALNFVTCEVHGSRVVLEGSVPSYHLKQLAQAFVLKVDGVARVENRLRVGMRTQA